MQTIVGIPLTTSACINFHWASSPSASWSLSPCKTRARLKANPLESPHQAGRVASASQLRIKAPHFEHVVLIALLAQFAEYHLGTSLATEINRNRTRYAKRIADFCGEACAEMVLRKLGKKGDQNYVFEMSGLDPKLGRGCYSAGLMRALKRIGFKDGRRVLHGGSSPRRRT